MDADYEHCAALVRERDRERFLSALFAPTEKRAHLYALYAFDLEIAHVPDAVREPMAGEIRFQWWREALSGERAEEALANPVAAGLLHTVEQYGLSRMALQVLIDARQFDLLGEPMNTRERLLEYLAATSGTIVAQAARVLDPAWPSEQATALAGRVIGITRLMRNLALDVSRGRLFIPLDLLAAHEVHTASVMGGENSEGLRAAVRELAHEASLALTQLRGTELPPAVLPAFLQAALTPLYLAQVNARGYDPFRSELSPSRLRSQYALWRAARKGRL